MTLDPLAARALKRANDAVREAPDSPDARANSVAAMQAAMSAAPKRRGRQGVQVLALAAGLGALIAAGLALRPAPAARVVSGGGAYEPGHRFEAGARVESGTATLQLELPAGIKLALDAQTSLVLGPTPVELRVERGEVAAEIAPRAEPFKLECGDTQIFTRGSRLRVTPGAGCDGRARVEVLEGEATIDGAVLQRGTWPTCAAAVRLISPPPEPPAQPAAAPTRAPRRDPPKPAVIVPPAPTAQQQAQDREERLARQNALYLEAVSLQRSGDTPAALQRLAQLLQDPTSPLAETALAQKLRWLAPTQRTAAREAAREYLRRYPMGFARAEAEQLVLEQP